MHTELLVIGFGKGGKTLAATMGRHGRRVVMVEQSDQMYGGTCINIGCIPSKALIHHANARTVALAMRAGVTASTLRDGIWTHPSSTEAFNEVLASTR
jgi:pyruvate/2-oxoglutarate dehydrogenase complex dihydrolipoamide dehydrogenase (E3) component